MERAACITDQGARNAALGMIGLDSDRLVVPDDFISLLVTQVHVRDAVFVIKLKGLLALALDFSSRLSYLERPLLLHYHHLIVWKLHI